MQQRPTIAVPIGNWVTATMGAVDEASAWARAEGWHKAFAPLVAAAEAPPVGVRDIGDAAGEPEVSVVLPVGGDPEAFLATAEALAAGGAGPGVQVVLVGDGIAAPDALAALAEAVAEECAMRVRVVTPAAPPTPAHAFSLGAMAARGELALFVHPEARPSSAASLDALVMFARRHPSVGVVGGRWLDPSRELVVEAGLDVVPSPLMPVWVAPKRCRALYRLDPTCTDPLPVSATGLTALLVRRAALEAAGGWPAGYLGEWFASADLCHRVWEAGWQVWVEPSAEFEREYPEPAILPERDAAWIHDAWLNDQRWDAALRRRAAQPAALLATAREAIAQGRMADAQVALDLLRCLPLAHPSLCEEAWHSQADAATPLAAWGENAGMVPLDAAWATVAAAESPGDDRLLVLAGDGAPGGGARLQELDDALAPLAPPTPLALRLAPADDGETDWRIKDARLVPDGARYLVSAAVQDDRFPGDPAWALLELDAPAAELRELPAARGALRPGEMPVAAEDGWRLVSVHGPTEAARLDPDTGARTAVARHDPPGLAATLRGASALLPIDDGYLGIVQDTLGGPEGIRRLHRFATLSADFELAALSLPFTLGEDPLARCTGLALAGDRVVVSCVDRDGARLVAVDAGEIPARLCDVASLMPAGPLAWPDPSPPAAQLPGMIARVAGAAAARTAVVLGRPADGDGGARGPAAIDGDTLADPAAALAAAGGDAIDLAVLDAARGFAQTLDDLVHAERIARRGGAVAIRNLALPGMASAAAAGEAMPDWAAGGDGWKVAAALAIVRPDLGLILVEPGEEAPGGMLLVTGLDPTNGLLAGAAPAMQRFLAGGPEETPALRQALEGRRPAALPLDAALLALALASVPRLQAGDRAAGTMPPLGELPVLIPAFNCPSYVANMVRQLRERRLVPVVADNASGDPAMLELLASLDDVPVVRFGRNLGGQFFVGERFYPLLPERFCLTDPDLGLNPAMPEDFLVHLAAAAEEFRIGKAGLALDKDDRETLGDHVHRSRTKRRDFRAWEWEEQFWRVRLGETAGGDPVYEAFVDTTFFLLDKRFCEPVNHGAGVRVAGRFTARHLPWYRDCPVASAVEKVRYAAARQIGQWSGHHGPGDDADTVAIVPSRGRPDAARACVTALRDASVRSRIVLAVDEDDPELPAYRAIPGAALAPGPWRGQQAAVNRVAAAFADRCRHLAVVPDDALVRTLGWDALAAAAIWDLPSGIALVGQPAAGRAPVVLLRAAAARRPDPLVPEVLTEGAVEAYWTGLSAGLGGPRRRPEVVVERLAPETPPPRPARPDDDDVLRRIAGRSAEDLDATIRLSREFGFACALLPGAGEDLVAASLARGLARHLGPLAGPDGAPLAEALEVARAGSLDAATLAAILADPGWRFAAVVRHPQARIVALHRRLERRFAASGGRDPELRRAGFSGSAPPDFATFVRALAERPDAETYPAWRSQAALLPVSPERLTFLGRHETLESDLPELGRHLFGGEGFGDPDPEADPISASAEDDPLPPLAGLYTPELAQLVADRYAVDFAAFRYDPERFPDAPEDVPTSRSRAPRRGPDPAARPVVYHLGSGGFVHQLNLLGNSFSYCQRFGATLAPIMDATQEWGVPFHDFFEALAPEFATPEELSGLLDEIGARLGLPIASHREIRFGWHPEPPVNYDLLGDLAGLRSLALDWERGSGGQDILTVGTPWPPQGTPEGWLAVIDAIALQGWVQRELARRVAPLPDRYVGAHFRNTDIASDLERAAIAVRAAAAAHGLDDVFWATDDPASQQEIAALLPELRIHTLFVPPSVRESAVAATHFMFPEQLAEAGLTKTELLLGSLADVLALIRADAFVPSGNTTGWTGFVGNLRERPATVERFFGPLSS